MKNKNLEESILEIKEIAEKRAVIVRDLLQVFGGRGTLLLTIFLVIPFCLPIQIPGLSMPFGLAIFFICLRMAFRRKIWLTSGVLNHEIKKKHIETISNWGLWLIKKIRPVIHPRLNWFGSKGYLIRMHYLFLAVLGLILALPLPIPLSNILAAWSIFLISLGLIEDDGVLVLIGYGVAFFAFLLFGYIFLFLKTQFIQYI